METRLVADIGDVSAQAWDALTGEDDPFCEHAFLRALETSGSVGAGSGWTPMHVTVSQAGELVGALPLYVKDHSYGEYIFDWGWADAAMRAGIPYYPKLVSMIPVSPVTGRRVLLREDVDAGVVTAALLAGVREAAQRVQASSIHIHFLTHDERALLLADGELMPRLSFQFHWQNQGYGCFDDFLQRLRSGVRKQVRRERRKVSEAGVTIRTLEGPELSSEHWHYLDHVYRDTCHKRGSHPYLTPSFFEEIRANLAHRVVAVVAEKYERPVAASLSFEKGGHLYGRYWGCTEDYDALHFELCYYRLIERAIDRGMRRFEAGAQGMHKLRRGLLPVPIHSVCWMRHPALAEAVYNVLPREAFTVQQQIEELRGQGPFRRD